MMGAVVKNIIKLWLNMTGECSSASLAGSRPAICQWSTLSAENGTMLTWIRKFEVTGSDLDIAYSKSRMMQRRLAPAVNSPAVF
jgi:hypothetical protein